MREEPVAFGFLLLGGAVAAIAAAATHDLGIATALAALGAALGGIGVLVLLSPVIGRAHAVEAPMVGAPLVVLRESFQSGPLGRQAIVSTVASLEQTRTRGAEARMSPDEERRLIASPLDEFRAWLDERLDLLERET
ncbi:MAG: hypothetical protein L3J80_01415 [Thermoplasmata archaeon]|nr:hypothetical protein [Thermoplasmata archaeon]